MRLRTVAIFLAAAVMLAGCVTTTSTMLGDATKGGIIPVESVKIYRVASQVPGPYEEVALLHSTGSTDYTDETTMYASMKRAAAEMGADGVILDSMSEPSAGAQIAAAVFGMSTQRKGKAVAIRLLRPPSAATPVVSSPAPSVPAPPAQGMTTAPATEKPSTSAKPCGMVRQPDGSMKRVSC